ncbi:MAG: DUF1275 domain-containing protein [Butyrivibrio sp.]|nr:DUF1275 domain-containing protein [Butyrivibrio sp.]
MSVVKIEDYQVSDTFLVGGILSLSGGFQDAYTYVLRDNVFANAQTGNIVLMALSLMLGQFARGVRYLLPVIAFVCGIIVSEQISHRYKHSHKLHWRQIVLCIEILFLTLVAFIPGTLNVLANVLVSFTCAMQVQSFRKVRGYTYASTMCIGNLRSGTESLSVFFRNKDKASFVKAMHYYGIIFMFAIGAGVGGILSSLLGIRSILISSALLVIAFILMMKKRF